MTTSDHQKGGTCRLCAWVTLCAIAIGALVGPARAHADLRGEQPPWALTPDERKAARWMVYERERQPGDALCALGAMTIGLVWHGYGHYCLGELDDMYSMLWLEGSSLALILGGAGLALGTNDADAFNPLWRTLTYMGSMVFISTYLLDILGAAKGTSYELPPNQWQPEGVTMMLHTRWVPNDPFDFNIILGVEVQWIYERLRLSPQASSDLGGGFWHVGGDVAFRVWQGQWRGNYVAIGNTTRFEVYDPYAFEVLLTLPYVEWGLDVGTLFDHMRGVWLINRLGYGFEFYHWALLEDDAMFHDTTSLFTLETELALNVGDTTLLGLSYRLRPDMLVGGAARGVGLVGVRLQVLSAPFMVRLDTNIGTLFEFWLTIGAQFGGPDPLANLSSAPASP
jgi:hypothetical protein